MEQFYIVFPTHKSEYEAWTTAARDAGGSVLHYPSLDVAPLEHPSALDAAITGIATQNQAETWILLSAPVAAQTFSERVTALELNKEHWRAHIAFLGLATATTLQSQKNEALTKLGEPLYLDGLKDGDNALTNQIPTDAHLIVPVAHQAHEPLVAQLKRLGYAPRAVAAYSRFLAQGGDPVGSYLFEGRIDAIFFPSPEHLRFFRRRLLREGGVLSMLDHVRVYCLDAWTATVAGEYGLRVAGIAGSFEAMAITELVRMPA